MPSNQLAPNGGDTASHNSDTPTHDSDNETELQRKLRCLRTGQDYVRRFDRIVDPPYLRSPRYWFADGDVVLMTRNRIAQNVYDQERRYVSSMPPRIFKYVVKVHALLLRLASHYFDYILRYPPKPHAFENPADDEKGERIRLEIQREAEECTHVDLGEETPARLLMLLDYIYPHVPFQITWMNIDELVELGEMYQLDTPFEVAKRMMNWDNELCEFKDFEHRFVALAIVDRFRCRFPDALYDAVVDYVVRAGEHTTWTASLFRYCGWTMGAETRKRIIVGVRDAFGIEIGHLAACDSPPGPWKVGPMKEGKYTGNGGRDNVNCCASPKQVKGGWSGWSSLKPLWKK